MVYASTPTMLYTNYPVNSSSGWHRTLDTGRDIYASHSYDGGKTWTAAIKLQGEDGEDGRDGRDGADGSDANVTRGNIARALYENSSDYYNDGIYSYYYYGRYYLAINASYMQIDSGDMDAGRVTPNLLKVSLLPRETYGLCGKYIYQISVRENASSVDIPNQGILYITNNINKKYITG